MRAFAIGLRRKISRPNMKKGVVKLLMSAFARGLKPLITRRRELDTVLEKEKELE